MGSRLTVTGPGGHSQGVEGHKSTAALFAVACPGDGAACMALSLLRSSRRDVLKSLWEGEGASAIAMLSMGLSADWRSWF